MHCKGNFFLYKLNISYLSPFLSIDSHSCLIDLTEQCTFYRKTNNSFRGGDCQEYHTRKGHLESRHANIKGLSCFNFFFVGGEVWKLFCQELGYIKDYVSHRYWFENPLGPFVCMVFGNTWKMSLAKVYYIWQSKPQKQVNTSTTRVGKIRSI